LGDHQIKLLADIKERVHPKILILSFTRSQNVSNLSKFLCSAEHKGRMFVTKQILGPIDYHNISRPTMIVSVPRDLFGYKHSSKYVPLYSVEQRHLYRFGTTRVSK